MNLKGKSAIITGAGRGLGRASALVLARSGVSLLILSRTARELEKTAENCRAFGVRVLVETGDVAQTETIDRSVARALAELGGIDILINNAAVIGPAGPLAGLSEAHWRRTMAVNLDAPVRFARCVVPHMRGKRQGKIINVTSGLGELVMPNLGAYSVSKAGLNHATRILAVELKEFNIQVNGLDPGVMDTSMQREIRAMGPERLGEGVYRQFVALHERGRLQPAEQAAELALFLASERSDKISGEIGSASDFAPLGFRVL